MNRRTAPQLGLSPIVPPDCRRFLADRLDGAALDNPHAAGCASCRAKAVAAEQFAALLRRRPAAPHELASPAFLEGVYERAVEALEKAPIAAELARGIPAPGAAIAEHPTGLLESATAELVLTNPPMPSALAWARVRQSVRADAQSVLSRHQVLRRLPFAVAVVAASVVIALVVRGDSDHPPSITFSDLASPPSLEMTILRHGPGH